MTALTNKKYLKEFQNIESESEQIEWIKRNPKKAAHIIWYLERGEDIINRL